LSSEELFKLHANKAEPADRPKTWRAPGGIPPSALKLSVSPPISRVLDGLRALTRRR